MMRKKDQQPKGKEEKVHCLQNQFFHIVFGPMGLGETLAFFFAFWDAMGNPMNGTEKEQEQKQQERNTIKNKWWEKVRKTTKRQGRKKQEQKYLQKKTKKQIKTYIILKDVCNLYFKMYVIVQWNTSLPAWHLASQNTKALPKALDTATFVDTTTSGTHICHQAPLILEVQTQKVIATTILVPLRQVSSTLRSTICQASRRERRWEFLTEQEADLPNVSSPRIRGLAAFCWFFVFFLFFFRCHILSYFYGETPYMYTLYIYIFFLGGGLDI